MPETPVLPKPDEILASGSKNGLPTPSMVFGEKKGINPNELIGQDVVATPDDILANVKTNNDNEKQLLKNLAIKVNEGKATHQELTDAILTIQGQHPKQQGQGSYFVENSDGVYIPKPLQKYEKPTQKNVVSVFQDKNALETAADSWERGKATLASSILRTPEFLYDLAVNENFNKVANLPKPLIENYNKVAKEQGLKEIPLPSNIPTSSELGDITGVHNELAQSVEKEAEKLGVDYHQKYDQGITDYWNKGEYGKALGVLSNSIIESAPTTIALALGGAAGLSATGGTLLGGAVFGAGKKAELDRDAPNMDETTKLGIATANGLLEGIFEQWGITRLGRMVGDVFKKEGKDAAKLFAEQAFKTTYAPAVGKYAGVVAEEGIGEAATQFAQNVVDKYSGYKPDLDLKQGVVDALIIGVGAAGGPAILGSKVETASEKANAKRMEQSAYLFDVAKKGTDAEVAFKADMENAVKGGRISPERAVEVAKQFNAYKAYHEQVGDLDLTDEQKKDVFSLSYQKQQLEATLGDDVIEKDLDPIQLAKRNAKQKQAKDLQKQIDEIVLREDVQKQPVTADKTEHDIVKGDEKQSGIKDILSRYGRLKSVKAEGEAINPTENKETKTETKPKKEKVIDSRPFEEIPFADWNQKRASEKFKILSTHLADTNTTQLGVITKPGLGNDTIHIELPDNKHVIFASSATSQKTGNRGHLRTEVLPEDFIGHKVVVKPIKLTTGKVVLPVYNTDNGKHVGFVREDDKGAAQFTDPEIEQLQHLITDKLTKPEMEAYKTQPLKVKPSINVKPAQSQEAYVKEQIDALSQDEEGDFDEELIPVYEQRFKELYDEQQRSTEGATPTSEELAAGNTTEVSGQDTKSSKKAKALRTGTKRANQKINDPSRVKALEVESTDPYDIALQYFIKNGIISYGAISSLFDGSRKEINKRFSLINKGGPTLKGLAHQLWEANAEQEKYDSMDYYNALEEALLNFHSRTEMANDINRRFENSSTKEEEIMTRMYGTAEKEGTEEEVDDIVDKVEELGNNDITDIAENLDNKLDDEGDDIITGEDQEPVFQKQSDKKGDIEKIVNHLKKLMPKIKVEFDENLVDNEGKPAAGKWNPNTKTITINPFYAGTDTPIHEYGHILIDAIGYNNSIVQLAIKQLQGTPLWNSIKESYPNLSEEMLGKEVLAEAIGREGADIFDKESEKSKFRQYLSYIFDWFKTKLGINKNVAKSLAKQIIGGINTKNIQDDETGKMGFGLFSKNNRNGNKNGEKGIYEFSMGRREGITSSDGKTGVETEQYQKPKRKPKTLEEKSIDELKRGMVANFDTYRSSVLGRNLIQLKNDLNLITEALNDPNTDQDTKDTLTAIQANLKRQEKSDLKAWYDYKEDMDYITSIAAEKDLDERPVDELVKIYNTIANYQDFAKSALLKGVMQRIAYRMFNERKAELSEHKKFVEAQADKQDLHPKDVLMKTLSHMTQNFPELQKFSTMFDNAYFDMTEDRYELKKELETLGTAVIKEANKKQGITGKLGSFFSSDNAKYFEYLEHPDGRYYTPEEAKAKGYSPAQIKFLEYMLKLNDLRNNQIADMGIQDTNNEVLKVDKGVAEAFKQDGILQAFSNYLGNGFNVHNVRIPFADPITKKESILSYGEIEQKLLEYGKSGKVDKIKLLLKMLGASIRAKRQLGKGINADEKLHPLATKEGAEFQLNSNGQLVSKFNKQRDKGRGYSKDFYRAAFNFIDDYSHVKHMTPLIPYIEAIQHLNETGYEEHAKKPNVVKWVEDWKNMHIFKKDKQSSLGPEVDAGLRFLRKLTSQIVMAFNLPAGGWNIFIGQYNAWRDKSGLTGGEGHKRMFGKEGINPIAKEILKKYQVVSMDYESNPKLFAGRLFDNLAHGLTRLGEYYIQGSQFLGYMTDEDWNSFELKDGKLKVKDGVDEKALKERLLNYKNRVSDVQGKYNEKDRRNFMNGELGKVIGQFRVWLPDAFKSRFGNEYITRDGVIHKGTFRSFQLSALKDLRQQISDKGLFKTMLTGDNENAVNMRKNLKGALLLGFLWSMKSLNDDDEKKRRQGDLLDKAMGNVMGIFSLDQVKFMVKNPIAAMGTLSKFVDILSDALNGEEYKGKSKYGNKGDSKVPGDIAKVLPYNKMFLNDLTMPDDEDK